MLSEEEVVGLGVWVLFLFLPELLAISLLCIYKVVIVLDVFRSAAQLCSATPCPVMLLPYIHVTGIRSTSQSEISPCPSLLPLSYPDSWTLDSIPSCFPEDPNWHTGLIGPQEHLWGQSLLGLPSRGRPSHWIPSARDPQTVDLELLVRKGYRQRDSRHQHYLSSSTWKLCLWRIKITGNEKLSRKMVSIFFFLTLIYNTKMTDSWQSKECTLERLGKCFRDKAY